MGWEPQPVAGKKSVFWTICKLVFFVELVIRLITIVPDKSDSYDMAAWKIRADPCLVQLRGCLKLSVFVFQYGPTSTEHCMFSSFYCAADINNTITHFFGINQRQKNSIFIHFWNESAWKSRRFFLFSSWGAQCQVFPRSSDGQGKDTAFFCHFFIASAMKKNPCKSLHEDLKLVCKCNGFCSLWRFLKTPVSPFAQKTIPSQAALKPKPTNSLTSNQS